MTWGPIGGGGGGGGTSSATYTVTDALILGAATTSGVRLDLESGVLSVREGDDSAYATLRAYGLDSEGSSANEGVSINYDKVGASFGASAPIVWTSTSPAGTADTGLARDSAAQVVVTDGSTGIGNLRATALIVGTADTSGVRLDLESGTLAVREGDDSAYAGLIASIVYVGATTGPNLQNDRVVVQHSSNGGELIGGWADTIKVRPLPGTNAGNASFDICSAGNTSGALTSGGSYTFTNVRPAGAIIVGITARITTTVSGPTSVQVGDGSDADRYGEFSTLTSGQTITPANATATPLGWQSAAGDVVLTAVGGNFTAGVIRVVVHYINFTAPNT